MKKEDGKERDKSSKVLKSILHVSTMKYHSLSKLFFSLNERPRYTVTY